MTLRRISAPCQPAIKKFLARVGQTIRRYQMISSGQRILVAVSGGADSVALLHALHQLQDQLQVTLGVAHLNHGLRGNEAAADAAFVEQLARQLGLPCFYGRVDTAEYAHQQRLSLEDAGRQLRYRFLQQCAAEQAFQRIAVGHHQDDNAELILMNLLRGSGMRGLAGIPPQRDEIIIRPLSDTSRDQILNYLNRQHLSWVTDASNQDLTFLRNRIRHQLLPLLKQAYNPAIVRVLHRNAQIHRAEDVWLDSQINPIYNNLIVDRTSTGLLLNRFELARQPEVIVRRVLRRAVASLKGDLKRISLVQIEALRTLLESTGCSKSLDLPGGIQARITARELVLMRRAHSRRASPKHLPQQVSQRATPSFCYVLRRPPEHSPILMELPEAGRRLLFETLARAEFSHFGNENEEAWLDLDHLQFPLLVRNIEAQDRLRPLGMAGHKLVRRLIQEKPRISGSEKGLAAEAVMLSGSQVVWVVGRRIADDVKITSGTRRLLHIRIVTL